MIMGSGIGFGYNVAIENLAKEPVVQQDCND
jgi:hypothetical protein